MNLRSKTNIEKLKIEKLKMEKLKMEKVKIEMEKVKIERLKVFEALENVENVENVEKLLETIDELESRIFKTYKMDLEPLLDYYLSDGIDNFVWRIPTTEPIDERLADCLANRIHYFESKQDYEIPYEARLPYMKKWVFKNFTQEQLDELRTFPEPSFKFVKNYFIEHISGDGREGKMTNEKLDLVKECLIKNRIKESCLADLWENTSATDTAVREPIWEEVVALEMGCKVSKYDGIASRHDCLKKILG